MHSRLNLSIGLICLCFSPLGTAAEISGSLLYDAEPVSSVFPDITRARVRAVHREIPGEIEGTVDLASSTYSITVTETGQYGVKVLLDRIPPEDSLGQPGDLRQYMSVDLNQGDDAVTLDLDVRMNYHTVSPVDSNLALDGSGQDCPEFPAVGYPITFAIEPIPRAVEYQFTVVRYTCPSEVIDAIYPTSSHPSTTVEWGGAEEDYQNLWIQCVGASGRDLCAGPLYTYTDSLVWALLLRDAGSVGRGHHHTDAVVIPAVASAPGAGSSFWSSSVSVADLRDDDRQLEITYTPRDHDGTTTYSTDSVMISAGTMVSWDDIVADLFGTTGAGSVEIRGADLFVSSRTSTPAADGGSFGQGIPPLQPHEILHLAGAATATAAGVVENATFRTNLGLCEVWGESAEVTVTVKSADGAVLGGADYSLRPYENTQVNRVARTIAGASSLNGGMVEVTVTSGNGRVGAYLSVVDNQTDDPTYVVIAPQAPIGG